MFLLQDELQQYLPFTILKQIKFCTTFFTSKNALQQCLPLAVLKPFMVNVVFVIMQWLQQCLPFTVCDEGCETAEEQSDDEVRTSLVPDRREGKTEVIKKQHLPFMVYDYVASTFLTYNYISITKRAVLSVFITEAQLFHS